MRNDVCARRTTAELVAVGPVSGSPWRCVIATYDVAVVGGGIVGMATAMALLDPPGLRVVVLEAEDRLAPHQTGNNSGVVHSGLYYKPGSLKATNCVEGREALIRFCERHDVPLERCGKLVVATRREELPRLEELFRRGTANGLRGIRRIPGEQIPELEPHAVGLAALAVPETGIVDFVQVTEAFADRVRQSDGEIMLSTRVTACRRKAAELVLETRGCTVRCRNVVNCAGLHSDRVARMCGVDPGVAIIPFRGEYYVLVPHRRDLVRGLIYPVPDPQFPFLGVHFTRRIDGGVEAGPNAVLALKREGYRKLDFSLRDAASLVTLSGFWRMAARHWRMGFGEIHRSLSKGAFVHALRRLVPDLREADLIRGGAGVRAQAVAPDGFLLDDFRIVQADRMVHVLNAPSPAATASISIGGTIARIARAQFGA